MGKIPFGNYNIRMQKWNVWPR